MMRNAGKAVGSLAVLVMCALMLESVLADTAISYDAATGRTLTGTWGGSSDYRSCEKYSGPQATDSGTAQWAFTGLAGGTYNVYTRWTVNANRTTNAIYRINGGADIPRDQERSADFIRFYDDDAGGTSWALLGTTADSGGAITVTLTNASGLEADGAYLMANAVRVSLDPPYSILGNNGVGDVIALDNKDPGFSTSDDPTWEYNGSSGQFLPGGSESAGRLNRTTSETATWSFTGLPDGYYRVSATYQGQGWGNSQARYSLSTGGSVTADQTSTPSDILGTDADSGDVSWTDLATDLEITGGAFSVTLDPNGVINTQADAIRLEITKVMPKGTIVLIQ
jgi:hypothetical protein